jgi:hypothetical protein
MLVISELFHPLPKLSALFRGTFTLLFDTPLGVYMTNPWWCVYMYTLDGVPTTLVVCTEGALTVCTCISVFFVAAATLCPV